ncbi:MAG: hypothetical protein AAGJ79_01035 [Verrucomicrobiota bacterium]
MKTTFLLPAISIVTCAITSCSTVSISNTGNNRLYSGELSQMDVLGLTSESPVSLASYKNWSPPRNGGRILLVQSGAMMPDPALLDAFEQRFDVVAFSGLKSDYSARSSSGLKKEAIPTARKMRAAAAAAGAKHIVCVWGSVESEDVQHATKAVSWVPVAGGIVPDETEHMRLSLKAGIIDTTSGQWDSVSHYSPVSKSVSANLNRSVRRTQHIESAKESGYEVLAEKVARH